jgi:inosine-uridine nucleoside N-ribohydrolase
MRFVIFDTDIGTDVDDILALVLLAKAPELKLLGVTTVYGDTAFRAKIAKTTTHMLRREDIAIVPGEQHTLSGRQVHWAGHEGEGVPNVDAFEVKAEQSAPSYIGETAEAMAGELEVIATGPLTNIARAITAAPASCARIKHLYIMGGAFWPGRRGCVRTDSGTGDRAADCWVRRFHHTVTEVRAADSVDSRKTSHRLHRLSQRKWRVRARVRERNDSR